MGTCRTILAVEDEAVIRKLLRRIFESRDDWSLVMAEDLSSAQKALHDMPPDLVLLDVNLPDGNGIQFCAQMRQSPQWQNIPIVFVTGSADAGTRLKAWFRGGDAFVSKPFDPIHLLTIVRRILNKTVSNEG